MTVKHVAPVLVVLMAMAAAGTPAYASLPRTYQVQRVDSPQATVGGNFGIAFVNAGDLNRDGKDDLIVGTDEHGGSTGTVFAISGADGSLIRSIASPDPDGAGTKASFGSYVGKLGDIGSCSGGTAGKVCPNATVGASDGVPDLLVTALGVDVGGLVDAGRAYVIDGATGAVLKRVDMPAADIAEQQAITPRPKPAFGRTILNPSSPYGPTVANPDGTTSPGTPPAAVRNGDMTGDGVPDFIVGASDFYETGATANPESACAVSPLNQCLQAGRAYVYSGAAVAGSDPSAILSAPVRTVKNPAAQPDDPLTPVNNNRDNLAYSVAPVGDVGRCKTNPGPGLACTAVNSDTAPDGVPDVAISSHRSDDFGMFDVGVVPLIDGATGSVLYIYRHPEPQPASLFGFSNYNQPAVGDMGSSSSPDVYQAAMRQNNPYTGGGRAYVMNGSFRQTGSPNSISFASFSDPTPNPSEDFGTSSAGIGDVVGNAGGLDGRTEVLIGAYGPHNPGTNPYVINDVHIFSALTEQPLQTIPAPDQQAGSGFGTAVAPLGDLNGDAFLDYAVGAGLYDGTTGADQGRVYIFRSDNSPAPPPPPGPPPPPSPTATALAGRTLELAPSATTVRRGRSVTLRGRLEAFANVAPCTSKQRISLQRRSSSSPSYTTFAHATTDAGGRFRARTRPRRTLVYRARVSQSDACLGAASAGVRVSVLRKRSARR